jgi:DNA end-binding protein Ku
MHKKLIVVPVFKANNAVLVAEQLTLICPYENRLIMHSLYYANEVRNFAHIAKAENAKLSDAEIQLGATLIENLSDEFEPEKHRDEYRERVQSKYQNRQGHGSSR